MAGIQPRKDASGNIHVNLESSSPCWNHVIERFFNRSRPFEAVFSKESRFICPPEVLTCSQRWALLSNAGGPAQQCLHPLPDHPHPCTSSDIPSHASTPE